MLKELSNISTCRCRWLLSRLQIDAFWFDPFHDIYASCEEIVSLAEEVVDVNHDEFIGCKERESQVDSDSEWEVDVNINAFSLFDE